MGERSQTVNSPFDNFSGGTEGTRMAEGRRSRRSCRRQGPEGVTGPVEDRNDLTGTFIETPIAYSLRL